MTNPIQNKHPEDNQLQSQIINQIIPILEKLVMQFIQNPAPNEDVIPGNDNKFMEIDDVVDNLVNAGNSIEGHIDEADKKEGTK
ncbi:hypothetical protein [Bacillus mycoides]|uniref:Uncharacterized protein n=1 Tax=Bacillus mycoides TaxID=1405 RepID=A0A4V5TQH0_BACMY|nr:hypothetical protein [Bacillus mycoides]TKI79683.1 hypothetical protein FC701_30935 [Bacillus mycoides]